MFWIDFWYFFKQTTIVMRLERLIIVLILFLSLFISKKTIAQTYIKNEVDSLLYLYTTLPEDSQKVEVMHKIWLYYLNRDFKKSLQFVKESISLSQKINYRNGYIRGLDGLGTLYSNQGDYAAALNYKLQALKMAEEDQNTKTIGRLNNSLGVIYYRQKKYKDALLYYEKALKIVEKTNEYEKISTYMLNIGEVYKDIGDYQQALSYEQQALSIAKKHGITDNIAYTLGIIGQVYEQQGKWEQAFSNTKEALNIFQSLDDGVSLAEYSIATARIAIKLNRGNEALQLAKNALQYAKETSNRHWQKEAYQQLAQVYAYQGEMNEAYKYQFQYSALQDSLINEETLKRVSQLQILYDTERKQIEIEKLNTEKKLQTENAAAQYRWNLILMSMLAILGIFAISLLYNIRQRKKAYDLLKLKNAEINQQKEEIEAQRDNIDIQKKEIEAQRQDILASINYAQRIQYAILPTPEQLQTILETHFILFKPRDIVSGDIYWATKYQSQILLAVIDCTGHGVPGAFMSMIAHEMLNEIVLVKKVFSPAEILRELHENIRKTLKQEANQNRDGMDVSFIRIDETNQTLSYAGARSTMYYVKNGHLEEIKPNKYPVGGEQMEKTRLFDEHTLPYNEPIWVYLTTDGYQDQFGGEKNRKITKRVLKQNLEQIHSLPPNEQKQHLEQYLKNWQGREPQIDDILMIGLKLG
ncbi:MAG: tetratricopeptide repeat protein [Cytophagales bacterium]|nr:MAG: tetratricopeptide repeat protein [Cytophagales bacterium]